MRARVWRTLIPPRIPPAVQLTPEYEDTPATRRAWARHLDAGASYAEARRSDETIVAISPELARELARILYRAADEMENAS